MQWTIEPKPKFWQLQVVLEGIKTKHSQQQAATKPSITHQHEKRQDRIQ